jgi:pimeloyl-ACP methyl ester carboxylesterase
VSAAVTNFVVARRGRLVRRPGLRHLLLAYIFRHPSRLAPDLVYHFMPNEHNDGFIAALDALTDYDFRHRLEEVKVPVLLVWGREDNLVPVEDADEFERLIPDARKVVLEDTGHCAMIERPETFNDLTVEFLDYKTQRSEPESISAGVAT